MREAGTAKIKVWNIAAELTAEMDDAKGAGPQAANLSLQGYANGIYLYAIEMQYGPDGSERIPIKSFIVSH